MVSIHCTAGPAGTEIRIFLYFFLFSFFFQNFSLRCFAARHARIFDFHQINRPIVDVLATGNDILTVGRGSNGKRWSTIRFKFEFRSRHAGRGNARVTRGCEAWPSIGTQSRTRSVRRSRGSSLDYSRKFRQKGNEFT